MFYCFEDDGWGTGWGEEPRVEIDSRQATVLECLNYQMSTTPQQIAERLGWGLAEIKEALQIFLQAGLIKEVSQGRWMRVRQEDINLG